MKEIQFHSDNALGTDAHPAINVKVYHWPDVDADESVRERAYDEVVRSFWLDAELIAQIHGYSGVFSEGRSGGWLVPFTQRNKEGKLITHWTGQGPDKGYPYYPDVENKKERKVFLEFQADIEKLLSEGKDRFVELCRLLA